MKADHNHVTMLNDFVLYLQLSKWQRCELFKLLPGKVFWKNLYLNNNNNNNILVCTTPGVTYSVTTTVTTTTTTTTTITASTTTSKDNSCN